MDFLCRRFSKKCRLRASITQHLLIMPVQDKAPMFSSSVGEESFTEDRQSALMIRELFF